MSCKVGALGLKPVPKTKTKIHEWSEGGEELCPRFSPLTQVSHDQTSCLTTAFPKTFDCVSCVFSSLVACVICMPPKGLGLLEATKAYQTEQQRLRTERRQAQLRQDQRQLELSEVLQLFALIWLALIVLLYARLYLGPQE